MLDYVLFGICRRVIVDENIISEIYLVFCRMLSMQSCLSYGREYICIILHSNFQ